MFTPFPSLTHFLPPIGSSWGHFLSNYLSLNPWLWFYFWGNTNQDPSFLCVRGTHQLTSTRLWAAKAMAPHSSALAWRIPETEKSGGLPSMGPHRVGHDWSDLAAAAGSEHEMAGWHHWPDGHESEWTSGVGDGQRGLVYYDSWGRKESDTTEWLNWTEALSNVDIKYPGIREGDIFLKLIEFPEICR